MLSPGTHPHAMEIIDRCDMTQSTVYSTQSSFPLPDVFSSALTELFRSAQPGIVQVRTDRRGGGTGIVWRSDGYIITNHHVVASNNASVQVLLSDGRTLAAKVLHSSPQLDLAMLKVPAQDLTALPVGKSATLRAGEWVFAIGHPWGQRWALTAGIVSSLSTMKPENGQTTQYIKSDVRLAPGNSGGPLLNADGHVVGVNAMIFGGDLSVSIPSDVVQSWIAELPRGRVVLGVEIQQVDLPIAVRQQLQPERGIGLLVVGTSARSASLQDLLVGDIILEVAGTPTSDAATLRKIVAQQQEGGALAAKLVRGGIVLDTSFVTQRVHDAA
jgi:serine protease Do